MHKLIKIVFGVGLLLVLGAALPLLTHTLGFSLHSPTAETSVAPPFRHPPASLTETQRPDLRPDLPASPSYSPVTNFTRTYRLLDLTDGTQRRAAIYDGGTGDAARPVVILLHGAQRTERSMIDMWDEVADAHGLVLISLKSPGATWDHARDDSDLITAFLDRTAQDIPIDRNRVALFGHSDGSVYAQTLANRRTGPWRAVAGHAGTVPVGWLQPRGNLPPIRHYIGDNDGIFDLPAARASAEALRDMGHAMELVVVPGHTHWFYEGGPEFAADAWDWFAEMMPVSGPPTGALAVN